MRHFAEISRGMKTHGTRPRAKLSNDSKTFAANNDRKFSATHKAPNRQRQQTAATKHITKQQTDQKCHRPLEGERDRLTAIKPQPELQGDEVGGTEVVGEPPCAVEAPLAVESRRGPRQEVQPLLGGP